MRKFNAVIQLPERDGTEYYVAAGTKYAIIRNSTDGDDRILEGPHEIKGNCPILKNTGWDRIDGAVGVPGLPNQFYIFHGGKYIRATLNKKLDKVQNEGIKYIESNWGPLTKVGFNTIDAGYPYTDEADKMVFYSGTEFVEYSWKDNKVVSGPKDFTHEEDYQKAGFNRIDAVFPSGDKKIWYYFCGNKYLRYKYDGARSGSKTLESGPWLIAESFESFRNWP
ncbi:hypothetical protein ASPSYDRAFT_1180715 [Aspergillus sydowii CBS 593.65]|uniref:Uncharacterized protein n=1 Tax=Aspergillus sydowii CBS 593.65 TaxID=1036612 RepID=A0A1L9TBS5_9EURO|nr:uncharacterized protein ASPSYDRAFT_1180715 [Aspergillus sydowii CBS 593.65]OJJ56890.1 hypothetical protein ASPSYDRAFT_1180715 [Aspergillus sydowii CBS 593.65]